MINIQYNLNRPWHKPGSRVFMTVDFKHPRDSSCKYYCFADAFLLPGNRLQMPEMVLRRFYGQDWYSEGNI